MSRPRPAITVVCLAALLVGVAAALAVGGEAEASGRAGLSRTARAFAEAMEGGAEGGVAFMEPRLAPAFERRRTAEALAVLSRRTLMPVRLGADPDGRGWVVFEVVEASWRGTRILGSLSTTWRRDRGAGSWWLVDVAVP